MLEFIRLVFNGRATGIPICERGTMNNRLVRPLQLIFSLAVLVYLYQQIPFAEVMAALWLARGPEVLTACALVLVMHLVGAHRLKLLTEKQGFTLGTWTLFEINVCSDFYKFFLPGGMLTSMGVRFYKLQKAEQKRAGALSAVIIDRIATIFGLAFVGTVFWIVDQPVSLQKFGWVMVGLMGLMVGGYVLLLGRVPARVMQTVANSLAVPSVARKMEACLDSLSLFRQMPVKNVALLAFLAVTPQLIGVLVFSYLADALGIPSSVMTWGWMRSGIILLTMLPISVAGLGVRDWALLYFLGYYGVSEAASLALALLVLGATVLLLVLLGGIFEARRLLRRSPSVTVI